MQVEHDFGMNMKIKKLDKDAIIPKYQTSGSAGFDFHSIEDAVIFPGEQKLIDTGLAVKVPDGYEMQIRPRSGMALKNMISITNSPGTCDQDYLGPVKILLINLGKKDFQVSKGDRIAQGIVSPVIQVKFEETDDLGDTERGTGGFGSTGQK